jgi:hypothetical protein
MKKKTGTKTRKAPVAKGPAPRKKLSAKAASRKANPKPGEALKKIAKKAEIAVKRAEKAVVAAVSGKAGAAVKQPVAVGPPKGGDGGFKKLYLKSRPVCKVTFRLPGEAAPEARAVTLVGDFNNWDAGASPMRRLKNGSFTATLSLETGHNYRFRYLIDGQRWENDWRADRYVKNSFGTDDSVVAV